MALEKKFQQFPFGSMGMNNSTDENVLGPDALFSVDNMRYERNGRLVNRPGLSINALGTSANTSGVTKLFTTTDDKVGCVSERGASYGLTNEQRRPILAYEDVITQSYRPFDELQNDAVPTAVRYQWGPAENIQCEIIGDWLVVCADHLGAAPLPPDTSLFEQPNLWTPDGLPINTDGIRAASFGVYNLAESRWQVLPRPLLTVSTAGVSSGFFVARPQILKVSSTTSQLDFVCLAHAWTSSSGTPVPSGPTSTHRVVLVSVTGPGFATASSVIQPSTAVFPVSTTGLGGSEYNYGQLVIVEAGTTSYIVWNPFDGNGARIVEYSSNRTLTLRVQDSFVGLTPTPNPARVLVGSIFQADNTGATRGRLYVCDTRKIGYFTIASDGSFSPAIASFFVFPTGGRTHGRSPVVLGANYYATIRSDEAAVGTDRAAIIALHTLSSSASIAEFKLPLGDASVQFYSQIFTAPARVNGTTNFPTLGDTPLVWVRVRNPAAVPSAQDAVLLCLDLGSAQIVAQARYPTNESGMQSFYRDDIRPSWTLPASVYTPPRVLDYNGLKLFCAFGAGAYSPATGPQSELGIYKIRFGAQAALPVRANEVFITGALPSVLSPSSLSPVSFYYNPTILSIEEDADDGDIGPGQYGYILVRKYINSEGLLVRGPPSIASYISLDFPTSALYLTLDNLPYSLGPSTSPQATVEIYRTTADGQVFYYAGDYKPELLSLASPPEYGFIDVTGDEELASQVPLYTTGGILPNDPAPPLNVAVIVGNRVFGVARENPARIYFSKVVRERQPLSFNADSYIDIALGSGPVTGLAALDDKLIIFKSRNIYVITGEGPNEAGVGSFSPISEITSEYGCTNPLSICVTSDGVWFEFLQSIKLLTRSLQIEDAGLPVENVMGTVISAAYNPLLREVTFCTYNPALAASPYQWYTYNTLYKKWASNLISAVGARVLDVTATKSAGCTFLVQNAPGGTTSAQQSILTANVLSTSDLYPAGLGPTPFLCALRTGFIAFDSVFAGFGRLYRVALIGSVAGSSVVNDATWNPTDPQRPVLLVRTDYDKSTVVDTIPFGTAATIPVDRPTTLVKSRVAQQVAHSYQFEVRWMSNSNRRLFLYALALEYGVKAGLTNNNIIPK